jgi:ADP-heptose:LPS heptosyltransferase/O-antigen/teichoic acid export membrane protein
MSLSSSADVVVRRRETAFWQSAGASIAAKAVGAVCLLAQVPIAVGHLGSELFGVWMTLVSALSLMAFADVGIGAGVQNEAAAYAGQSREAEAWKSGIDGVALLGLVGVVLAMMLLAAWRWLPWEDWLGLAAPKLAEDARRGLLVLIILFCVNLPLTVLARLAYGLQLGWLANVWTAAIQVLALFAVMLASGGGVGFAGFVAAAAWPVVIGNICLGVHLFRRMGWSASSLRRPDTAGMARLLKAGLPFTLPQLGALALSALPPVLISAVLGPASVTPWSLGQRLLGLFSQVQTMVLAPLWPAFTEARSRGDLVWLEKNYRRSVIVSALAIAAPQAAFALWGGPAVRIWSQGTVSLDLLTAAAFGFWAATTSLSQPPAFLLNSFGRAFGQGIYGGFSVAVIIACAPWSLRAGGLAGFAALAGGVFLAINVPCVYLEARKVLKIQRAPMREKRELRKRLLAGVCHLVGRMRRVRAERRVAVAIYKVDRVGDFVLALGALRFVAARVAKADLLLVLSESVRELAEREFPDVEKHYVAYRGEGARAALWAAWWNPLARGRVRADELICLRHQGGFFRKSILAGLGAKRSVGCEEGGGISSGREIFSERVNYPEVKRDELPAELRAHAAVLSNWSGERVIADDLLPALASSANVGGDVLICPFGSNAVRDYPDESWCKIVEGLRAAGRRVVFNGAEGDRARLHALAKKCGNVSADVTKDFSALLDLMMRADVVIAVETAAAHLATALDKPAVILIGGGHFGKCGPWARSARQTWLTHEQACFGCNWNCGQEEPWCVRRIVAEDVLKAVEASWAAVSAVDS